MLLDISVRVDGDKVVIEGLEKFSEAITGKAIPAGMTRIAAGTARLALARLTGPARGMKTIMARSGRQRAVAMREELAGGYPVPRVTSNLLRLQSYIGPGESRDGFSTGPMESVVFNSAEYAAAIHEGRGSSAKYGPRRFLDDAFEEFNRDAGAARVLEEEIEKVRKESGLG